VIDTLHEALVAPWTWGPWMARGALGALLASVTCAWLGVFLYLRRMSMIADALAHIALPGIVVGFVIAGMHPGAMLLGAIATGLVATRLIDVLSARRHVRADAAIGIVFTAAFALGVVGVSTLARGVHIDVDCVLFGNLLGITTNALWMLSVVAVVTLLAVASSSRWLIQSAFDPRTALASGVPVGLVHSGLLVMTTIAAVASFEAVGSILTVGFFVLPAATGHLLTRRIGAMIAVATAHAILSSIVGLYVAVWMDTSPAGAMIGVGGIFYALAWALGRRRA